MNSQNLVSELHRRQKEIWLKFADGYLCNSSNDFLKSFGSYLKEGYRDAEKSDNVFVESTWATKQHDILKHMLDFEAFTLSSKQAKGCALIGKSDFNKLEFIKNYFSTRSLFEFTGEETAGHYVVVDCLNIKGYNGLIKELVKNHDVAYIVFDNCDSLLKHDKAVQVFKHLSEDYPGLTIITKNNEAVNFKTESFFVFLGEENTLSIAVEKQILKGNGVSAYWHLNAFIHYVHVYDFNKGELYLGHDVTPPDIHL